MKEIIINYLADFPKPLAVYIMAMLPITELRASIPVGILMYKMPPVLVYLLSIAGNLTPVALILLLLSKVDNFLRNRYACSERFFDWLYQRTHKKGSKHFKKWGVAALIAFVAIPLPATGAWTGAILALLFDVPFKKAFPLIAIGIIIAGMIVTAITLVGNSIV